MVAEHNHPLRQGSQVIVVADCLSEGRILSERVNKGMDRAPVNPGPTVGGKRHIRVRRQFRLLAKGQDYERRCRSRPRYIC